MVIPRNEKLTIRPFGGLPYNGYRHRRTYNIWHTLACYCLGVVGGVWFSHRFYNGYSHFAPEYFDHQPFRYPKGHPKAHGH